MNQQAYHCFLTYYCFFIPSLWVMLKCKNKIIIPDTIFKNYNADAMHFI